VNTSKQAKDKEAGSLRKAKGKKGTTPIEYLDAWPPKPCDLAREAPKFTSPIKSEAVTARPYVIFIYFIKSFLFFN